jgi:ribA/ribD-fused uncharacterized protein
MTMPHSIDEFKGETYWLSNFYSHPFDLDGITYPSGEHAFHAYKTDDLNDGFRERIAAAATPGLAKKMGRSVNLRADWEDIKRDVMSDVVQARFADGALRKKLLDTGDALLIEGTQWHDNEWGSCVCEKHRAWAGKNWLGKALMVERANIRGESDVYSRVAVTGHRPNAMTPAQTSWAGEQLERLAEKLKTQHDTTAAISGFAIGADAMWSDAALEAGLNLWAYIPFEVQPSKWRPADVRKWESHRAAAVREVVLAKDYDVRLLHSRNDFMIRDADLMICVMDPSKTTGGTASAVKKIRAQGLAHIVVDIVDRKVRIVRATA